MQVHFSNTDMYHTVPTDSINIVRHVPVAVRIQLSQGLVPGKAVGFAFNNAGGNLSFTSKLSNIAFIQDICNYISNIQGS